jgi:hypothetical protein
MKKRYAVLLLLGMLMASAAYGQVEENRKGINWLLKEKMKVDPTWAIWQYAQHGGEEMPEELKSSLMHTDEPLVAGSNIDAEVHAAINPTDSFNILASPIRQAAGSLQVPIYYTKNFGGSWTRSLFNPMPSFAGGIPIGGGDPVLIYDNNGRAYFSWLELHVRNFTTDTIYWGLYWVYSDDGGETWVRPPDSEITLSRVVSATFAADKPVTDKQWMAIDRSSSQYRNNLYMSYVEIDLTTAEYRIVVHTKPADSLKFNPNPVTVTDASFTLCQFASLDVDIQGNIHVSFFGTKDNNNYGIYHARSTDGGLTFSQPVLVTPMQMPRFSAGQANLSVVGIDNDRLYPAVYLAANTVTNHVYITWTANGVNTKLNNGLDIYMAVSPDGGLTWNPPVVVNDDQSGFEAHQYYSSISCGVDGNVILGWYDRRNDTNNIMTHYYFTESFDHGATFLPNYQVTSQETDFSKVGLSNNNFGIGEYTQILGLKDYIIPVWTDGRSNNGNLNIYVAFINRKTMQIDKLTGVNHSFGIERIYPNPANERVSLEVTLHGAANIEVMLLDQTGRVVKAIHQGALPEGNHTIAGDVSQLPAGMYYLVVTADQDHYTSKVMISR